ncbi:MAG: nuclear transport factor 2 family protein [Candidatus Aminicenantales bacterium]
MMRQIRNLVEKRDAAGLLALVTDDYEDFEGRDKDATRALVEEHFAERRGIVVHLLDTEIAPGPVEGKATMETDVVLSSGAGFLLRKAVRFAGEFYRFELNLRKTPDGWRVGSARWSLSSRNELSAESVRLLQELFPGL